jgi:hypothetical protein
MYVSRLTGTVAIDNPTRQSFVTELVHRRTCAAPSG